MRFTVDLPTGDTLEFDGPEETSCRAAIVDTLVGRTYPLVPFVRDVEVIIDVGPGWGASAVHFARGYSTAQVHAFEPIRGTVDTLRTNVGALSNVVVHAVETGADPYGDRVPPVPGVLGSLVRSEGIERIDILKLGPGDARADVLAGFAAWLPSVQVLYVGYDARASRRSIAAAVELTHELYVGVLYLDSGDAIYLRRDLADHPDAAEHLRGLLRDALV